QSEIDFDLGELHRAVGVRVDLPDEPSIRDLALDRNACSETEDHGRNRLHQWSEHVSSLHERWQCSAGPLRRTRLRSPPCPQARSDEIDKRRIESQNSPTN